jgi:hypothetical protein
MGSTKETRRHLAGLYFSAEEIADMEARGDTDISSKNDGSII